MRAKHIRLDVSLLAALQALVEERSVTRAAERMFISQPAMSRAFDRLQELFGDELLVRTRQGYEPTQRAVQIYDELQTLLPRIDGLLQGDAFNPATASATFRIAATDYVTVVLLPTLMGRLLREAPGIALEIVNWDERAFHRLEANTLDLALWMNSAPPEFRTEVLFTDRFMCLVRKGHPVGRHPLTLERYLAYPHAVVTLADQRQGVVDRALEDLGITRRVQLRVPYFSSAAWMIEQSDMILTLPRRLATQLAAVSNTRVLPTPMEIAEFRYIQVWHPRVDSNRAHQWLRRLLMDVCRETAAD